MYYKFISAFDSPKSVNTSSKTTTFMVQETGGYYVEAYGPVVRRSDGDPEWSTRNSTATDTTSSTSTRTLPTSTSEPASSEGGLSVGASAGIGVGVAIGFIIFISCTAAAYIIGKRRRKAAAQGPDGLENPPYRNSIPASGQLAEPTGSEYNHGSYRAAVISCRRWTSPDIGVRRTQIIVQSSFRPLKDRAIMGELGTHNRQPNK